MTRVVVAWGPAILWAAVLFYLSSMTFDDGPPLVNINDKVAHGILFGILGATLGWAREYGRMAWPHLLFLLLGFLYALSDEFHQRFVPGRTPSLADAAADLAGLVVGYVLALRWAPGPTADAA